MIIDKLKFLSFWAILLLLVSCIDETFKDSEPKEGYIVIKGFNTRSYEGGSQGDGIDDKVETLRILAFDKTTHICKSNVLYDESYLIGTTLRHPIDQGEYDFIFLANEPLHTDIKAQLNNISNYDDIKSISYPAAFFDVERFIPMIAENNAVKVIPGGKIEVNNVEGMELSVNLRRLGVRVDVILKSKVDFGDDGTNGFKGIIFSNIPDKVPLVYGLPSDYLPGYWSYADPNPDYNGAAITRDVEREFTLEDNADYFKIDKTLLTSADKNNGLVWAVKVKKVILPSNFFFAKDDEENAVTFTVSLVDKYSPSCKLMILSDPDYTLPANAKLELTGIIKEPLEVNIEASPWIPDGDDWDISGVRILNVSQIEAKMTDLNGVRISFWSNMPVVKVLDTVKKEGEGNERATNTVFNCLAVDANNPSPYRFYFDPATGNGYMDLLIDGTSQTIAGATHDRTENMSGIYTLTLSAEDKNGKNALRRKIKVTVTQEGLRFVHNPTANAHGLFNGVFFKHDQKGERIITGQHLINEEWSVTVPSEYRDWLVVSATPSFDPGVGTESPGDAENYPVTLNQYKKENGYSITGLKGRIYFRIGIKKSAVADENAKPKFGYITLNCYLTWKANLRIYIRQGEAPYYIYDKDDAIPGDVMNGWNGDQWINSEVGEDMRLLASNSRKGAAKFSPFNLTTTKLAGSTNPDYDNVDIKGARFVDFPSQAGAFFQWAVDLNGTPEMKAYRRRAYNPRKSWNSHAFPWDYKEFPIMWDGKADIPAYKEEFEVCPPGYHRPTDGYTDKIAYNGYYDYLPSEGSTATDFTNYKDEIEYSEFRVSLFNVPFAGNASSSADYKTAFNGSVSLDTGPGTYPYGTGGIARKQLKGTAFTFYSDGFFDRRPIKEASNGNYGVSLGNSKVAYQGVLYFNPDTYASIFFPATGRLNNTNGNLEGAGSTGYYWSSSVGPEYVRDELTNLNYNRKIRYGAWSFESAYNSHNLRMAYQGFAYAMRCVKDETVEN